MSERNKLLLMVEVFLGAYFLPIENIRVQGALVEGFTMLKDYAREHVLLCLVPAFFIAGAISVFVSTLMMVGIITAPMESQFFNRKIMLIRKGLSFAVSFVIAIVIGRVVG